MAMRRLASRLAVLAVLSTAAGRTADPEAAANLHAAPSDAGSAMVIVEPRRHGALPYVLRNFDAHMPPHYDLYVFHGASAGEHARAAAAGIEQRRAVYFVPLPSDDLTEGDYNALLKSRPGFWDKISAEHVLVFQSDSVLCGASPHPVSHFEHLGYIGCLSAPDGQMGPNAPSLRHAPYFAIWGSGGLSFRRKSAALACLAARQGLPASYPEDLLFSRCVDEGLGTPPPGSAWVAAFCSQDAFEARSMGAHRIHDRLRRAQLLDFLIYCPEAAPLLTSPGADANLSAPGAGQVFWDEWRQARFMS